MEHCITVLHGWVVVGARNPVDGLAALAACFALTPACSNRIGQSPLKRLPQALSGLVPALGLVLENLREELLGALGALADVTEEFFLGAVFDDLPGVAVRRTA